MKFFKYNIFIIIFIFIITNIHYSKTNEIYNTYINYPSKYMHTVDYIKKNKYCYFTFDDGPSLNTDYILDVLDKYNAKATFFVIYKPHYKNQYIKIINKGHNIGIHCTNHNKNIVYASFEKWLKDFNNIYNFVYETTGHKSTLYRFPFGSSNNAIPNELKTKIINYLHTNGIEYYDWNISSSDSTVGITIEEIKNNITSNISQRKVPLILMHDGASKIETVKSLPLILEELQIMGYQFQKLDNTVPPIQQKIHWDYK